MSTAQLGKVLQECRSSEKLASELGFTSCCIQELEVCFSDEMLLSWLHATNSSRLLSDVTIHAVHCIFRKLRT